ncbi:flagellar hook-length control protein FliK [Sulfitobacter sp. F26169L]|uniref:flagellar hook-length control protein FliK n=1 Tax=Sulfitobacter sp. F26169L TaxID=2996015 RepID=UPI002260D8FB|nr:flagellar hook-length control protein FliK [Sulfitobacter sp. F26169L]MCX7565797.1 flagellar hook-length control protein FliK [Sulfitobacter sp. F26169L]
MKTPVAQIANTVIPMVINTPKTPLSTEETEAGHPDFGAFLAMLPNTEKEDPSGTIDRDQLLQNDAPLPKEKSQTTASHTIEQRETASNARSSGTPEKRHQLDSFSEERSVSSRIEGELGSASSPANTTNVTEGNPRSIALERLPTNANLASALTATQFQMQTADDKVKQAEAMTLPVTRETKKNSPDQSDPKFLRNGWNEDQTGGILDENGSGTARKKGLYGSGAAISTEPDARLPPARTSSSRDSVSTNTSTALNKSTQSTSDVFTQTGMEPAKLADQVRGPRQSDSISKPKPVHADPLNGNAQSENDATESFRKPKSAKMLDSILIPTGSNAGAPTMATTAPPYRRDSPLSLGQAFDHVDSQVEAGGQKPKVLLPEKQSSRRAGLPTIHTSLTDQDNRSGDIHLTTGKSHQTTTRSQTEETPASGIIRKLLPAKHAGKIEDGVGIKPSLMASLESPDLSSWDSVRISNIPQSALQPLRSELPPHVARQMIEVMVQAVHRPVEIALSPQELGRVRMSIITDDGAITVNIIAERADTIDLMRRHIDQLGQTFRNMGYEQINFAFGHGASRGDEGEKQPHDGQTGTLPDGDERTVQETNAETAVIQLDSLSESGVDIRL